MPTARIPIIDDEGTLSRMRSDLLAVAGLTALQVACTPAPAAPAPVAPVAGFTTPAPTCPTTPASPFATTPAPVTNSTAGSPAPPDKEPPPLPRALEDALAAAGKAIAAGDPIDADKAIDAAAAVAGDDPHLAYLVAHVRAARFVYSGDFERAAAAFVAVIPALAKHPELADEFWAHNAMMMIREAQGDPAAALAEDDQATLCAARGTWNPEGRETLAFQKDRWHRAYLTRMLAESRSGSVKQALVQYAEAALDEYRTHGFPDSVAILDAYFAALDGKRDAALAAAKRVDPTKDDDVEDLYLVVVGLEAGGDHAGAEAVRRIMRRPSGIRVSRAIMLRWIDIDSKAANARGFTPWHAGTR
jgi:hypothetical protein